MTQSLPSVFTVRVTLLFSWRLRRANGRAGFGAPARRDRLPDPESSSPNRACGKPPGGAEAGIWLGASGSFSLPAPLDVGAELGGREPSLKPPAGRADTRACPAAATAFRAETHLLTAGEQCSSVIPVRTSSCEGWAARPRAGSRAPPSLRLPSPPRFELCHHANIL